MNDVRPIPKVLAYADDLTCLVKDKKSIKLIFKEYENLSHSSGLLLNAEKTEIIRLGACNDAEIKVRYLNQSYKIDTTTEGKLNGIFISSDSDRAKQLNFNKVRSSLMAQLGMWQSRALTLLGRILIIKTFGYSQLLYTASVTTFSIEEMSDIKRIINCFLWKKPFTYKNPRSTFSDKNNSTA